MIVTRIVQYEGSASWIEETLGRSLADGTRETKDGTISILTVGNCTMLEVYKALEGEDETDS